MRHTVTVQGEREKTAQRQDFRSIFLNINVKITALLLCGHFPITPPPFPFPGAHHWPVPKHSQDWVLRWTLEQASISALGLYLWQTRANPGETTGSFGWVWEKRSESLLWRVLGLPVFCTQLFFVLYCFTRVCPCIPMLNPFLVFPKLRVLSITLQSPPEAWKVLVRL